MKIMINTMLSHGEGMHEIELMEVDNLTEKDVVFSMFHAKKSMPKDTELFARDAQLQLKQELMRKLTGMGVLPRNKMFPCKDPSTENTRLIFWIYRNMNIHNTKKFDLHYAVEVK